MTTKINYDFVEWMSTVATNKGSATIASWTEMTKITTIMAELKEALYKNTHKSGSYWVLVSPRIASYLNSTLSSNLDNLSLTSGVMTGRANNFENGFVTIIGDIEVYQHDFNEATDSPLVTGGVVDNAETDTVIYMGYRGGPGTASVYYTPYNEYIVQGGEDYMTGQSNVFYRVRDSWETNPLDTYDRTSVTDPVIEFGGDPTDMTDPKEKNKSQYIVKANITLPAGLLS
jgi:hypothetical protein